MVTGTSLSPRLFAVKTKRRRGRPGERPRKAPLATKKRSVRTTRMTLIESINGPMWTKLHRLIERRVQLQDPLRHLDHKQARLRWPRLVAKSSWLALLVRTVTYYVMLSNAAAAVLVTLYESVFTTCRWWDIESIGGVDR